MGKAAKHQIRGIKMLLEAKDDCKSGEKVKVLIAPNDLRSLIAEVQFFIQPEDLVVVEEKT